MTSMTISIIEGTVVDGQVEFLDTSGMRIEGVYRENMTFEDGLSYLRSYQDGTLHHPAMENLNYLFIRDDGELAYLDFAKQEVEIIRDLAEFDEENEWPPDWYYLPVCEQALINDGLGTFERVKIQEPINPSVDLPSPK
ncbi:hypothetical protein [Mesorhizobium sp. SP-1A]|uniref:hypothetical protein n=1 Tax=Mesorhizobium sp. SP-1A TaxID=3077840 RepID=UPI0028F70683|nr:hypothetical protein [Mesorhizobium sp. SP-1A]